MDCNARNLESSPRYQTVASMDERGSPHPDYKYKDTLNITGKSGVPRHKIHVYRKFVH